MQDMFCYCMETTSHTMSSAKIPPVPPAYCLTKPQRLELGKALQH